MNSKLINLLIFIIIVRQEADKYMSDDYLVEIFKRYVSIREVSIDDIKIIKKYSSNNNLKKTIDKIFTYVKIDDIPTDIKNTHPNILSYINSIISDTKYKSIIRMFNLRLININNEL